jgi:hypothetical protein
MLFLVEWILRPETRDEVIRRFKETGGAPPGGAKMLGRWHALSQSNGLAIVESSDPGAMAKWALEWSDLMEMEITPVVDDEGLTEILGG